MNLDDQQKDIIRNWIQDGLQLNEIQKNIADEFGLKLTYMDLRFLLSDLELTPLDKEEPKEEEPAPDAEPTPETAAAPDESDQAEELPQDDSIPGGDVSVTVDEITRPGFHISGKVTFSDGKKAEWFIDEMGRPGINPEEEGYRPTQDDIMKFQVELQKTLSGGRI